MQENIKTHMNNYFKHKIRYDGRKTDEYREISVETKISKNAEGSCRVKIGDTEILVGVKLEMGNPYSDRPDEGTIMVGAELLPLSSSKFESGPPSIKSVELARVIDRGIRESGVIDFKRLCIEPGEKIWIVIIDIVTINVDGNLFDASSLGAMIALKNTRLPKVEDGVVNYHELTEEGLPLSDKDPLSITVYKICDTIFVDPTEAEEEVADARLTIAITKEGNISAMQKGGSAPLSIDDVSAMVDLAYKKCDELRKYLN